MTSRGEVIAYRAFVHIGDIPEIGKLPGYAIQKLQALVAAEINAATEMPPPVGIRRKLPKTTQDACSPEK